MKRIVMTLLLAMMTTVIFAQKFKNEKGDLSVLKGEKEVNLEFVYDDLKFYNERISEDEYIKRRIEDLDSKNPGSGEIWKKKWDSAREGIWHPKFQELLIKTATAERGISFKEGLTSAKYTLVVDVVWIYPGWDAAVMKQPAKVSTKLKVVETANKSNVLYEVFAEHAPGNQWGSNFSNESRIGEGFAKTAKTLGKWIVKKTK